MPGIVVFRRRWSVGSDDLVLPAILLFVLHAIWLVILSVVVFGVPFDPTRNCPRDLLAHGRGYLLVLLGSSASEGALVWVSMRGSILYTRPRAAMPYLLYTRFGILLLELVYSVVGLLWILQWYSACEDRIARSITVGIVTCNWLVILSVCVTVVCVFDSTGRTFVRLQARRQRQRSLTTFSLRHRMEEGLTSSWHQRLRLFACCSRTRDTQTDAYSEVAVLFAEFFRDLDLVPSDLIAGLVLLRQEQRRKRHAVLDETNNDIIAFLSGIPITRRTKYLDLKDPSVMLRYKDVCYFMNYALAAYGWPLYLVTHPATGICHLLASCSCCCLPCCRKHRYAPTVTLEEDNSCSCHSAAIRRHFADRGLGSIDIVFASFHDAVYETPFFVAVDHEKKKVVISVRGTLSLKDALTDLSGDAEHLPVEGHQGTWLGHRGMVLSAKYVKKKLEEEMILSQAFGRDLARGTKYYGLVVVGHSLGAGTAAILSFFLRPNYPGISCFAYSPPGGLLSEDAMEKSKEFVTSVVLGKDVVPRIGLPQLEGFRRQLLEVLQKSDKPKWRIIAGGTRCFPKTELLSEAELSELVAGRLGSSPSELSVAPLSTSIPLYPPGNIIHVLHTHPKDMCCWRQKDPTYTAIWADNHSLAKVVISPAMLHEHLAHVVMEGLHKVLDNYNKGRTALLGAAKVMASPTEVDLHPGLTLELESTNPPGDCSHSTEPHNSNWEVLDPSESDPLGHVAATPISPAQLAPLATAESLSDSDSVASFDSRRSSGLRSVRGSPSLQALAEEDESGFTLSPHPLAFPPAFPLPGSDIPEESERSASSQGERTATERSGTFTPVPLHQPVASPVPGSSPSDAVARFARFLDSVFEHQTSVANSYQLTFDDEHDGDYVIGGVGQASKNETSPNGSADGITSSGVSASRSGPLTSSGDADTASPVFLTSNELLVTIASPGYTSPCKTKPSQSSPSPEAPPGPRDFLSPLPLPSHQDGELEPVDCYVSSV
uniref:diacylglycerol lipase-alpha-like isoform X1 n=2 Tax=Myxine glutinosa TaxID=7769 RepID=UPI00358E918F